MNRDHDWLKSTTYKPCDIKDYVIEEKEKSVNELVSGDSDSSNSSILSKPRLKKKRKHKKIKRGKIIKHYLKLLSSISDEKCEFRKYNFLEQMPKEERSDNFFVDLKGNSQIGHYGCIYEKHVPKYRSKTTENSKKRISEQRYFNKLKSIKSTDPFLTIEKRLCDSRCICKQSFIPVPFDIDLPGKEIPSKQNENCKNQALNETVARDPHNIDAWLRLINIQSESSQIGQSKLASSSLIAERQLMIVEKALSRNSSNLQLHLQRMMLGAALWTPDKLQKEWGQLIFTHSTNIDVWRFYIDQTARHAIGFSVDKLVAIYSRCFSTFYNVMSGRTRVKTVSADTIYELIDLFAELCDTLAEAGYRERALACWQAVIEYNLFAPAGLAPRSTGSLLDDPMLQSFQRFWESGSARIGTRGARGWAASTVDASGGGDPSGAGTDPSDSDRLERGLLARDELSESELWLALEQARLRDWWCPVTVGAAAEPDECAPEDPERLVPFSVVQPNLITLHDPQNIDSVLPVAEVTRRARRMLSLLFLDFLDYSSVSILISHELAPARIRWRQLNALPLPLAPVQVMAPTSFVTACLEQLRAALPADPGWSSTIASLELTRAFQMIAAEPQLSWKQALTTVKKTAKLVLAGSPDNRYLWTEYARLLTEMVATESRFSSCPKARGAITKEAGTVVEWVLQRVVTGRLDDDSLGVLVVSLELVRHSCGSHGDHSQVVEQALQRAAATVKDMLGYRSLGPITSLEAVAELFANAVAVGNATGNFRGWHFLVYFQALTQLVTLDVQKFQKWMEEECLLTISGVGSSCLWSRQFLYQLSQLLEWLSSFIAWFYHCQNRNDAAILRVLLGPVTHAFSQIQSSIKVPILEDVISPKLVQNCIGSSTVGQTQRFAVRNFLWHLVSAFETDIGHRFNRNCQAIILLLLSMEISRLDDCTDSREIDALIIPTNSSGRLERVRSTLNRLIGLNCSHWRYRSAIWHAFLAFESRGQCQLPRRDNLIKGVFYRAVTEMPAIKSLYLAAVSLVPSILDEAAQLMRNNHLRICTPIEEVKLLIRIKQARSASKPESQEDQQ